MAAHLPVRVLSGEGPRDAAVFGVTALLPGHDLGCEQSAIGNTPIKALAIEDTNLHFRHVEPTAVLRRVVKDDAPQEGVGGVDAEHLLEADAKMGIEVVHDQMHAPCRGVDLVEQMLDEGHEVDLGTVIGHPRGTASALRLDGDEQVAGARAHILAIGLGWRTRLHRQWNAHLAKQLLALFVDADDRLAGAKRFRVQVKQRVHALPVLCGQYADAPHQLAPRFEAVFFSNRRMVSRLIGPIPAWTWAACSSSANVQRVAPTGGAEQAKAAICASVSVPYWRGLPGRASSCSAYSKPRSRYAARVRQMAVRPTPKTSMICTSETPRSSAARICARLTSRAECQPFARNASINCRSFLVSRSSVWRIAVSSSGGRRAP